MEFEDVKYSEVASETIQKLASPGLLLVTQKGDDRPNIMTIGWGNIGIIWQKPIFIVLVRPTRFTFGIIEESGEFTVNVPSEGMKKAMGFCGTKSGRGYDKFKECDLTPHPARTVSVPIIGEADIFYECKVVYRQKLNAADLPPEIDRLYSMDYHTLYFGEILACYRKKRQIP